MIPTRSAISSATASVCVDMNTVLPAEARARLLEQRHDVRWRQGVALDAIESAWQASNPEHRFSAYFTESGVRVYPDAKAPTAALKVLWDSPMKTWGHGQPIFVDGKVFLVREVGPEVHGVRPGMRVTAPFCCGCGRCWHSRGSVTSRDGWTVPGWLSYRCRSRWSGCGWYLVWRPAGYCRG